MLSLTLMEHAAVVRARASADTTAEEIAATWWVWWVALRNAIPRHEYQCINHLRICTTCPFRDPAHGSALARIALQ